MPLHPKWNRAAVRVRASVEDAAPRRRARASTHPDTPSSHPRLDPSQAAPPSWRHAGTSSGKRRDDRTAGGCDGTSLPRSCWAVALGPPWRRRSARRCLAHSAGCPDRAGPRSAGAAVARWRHEPRPDWADAARPPDAAALAPRPPIGRRRIRRDPAPTRRSRALGAVDRRRPRPHRTRRPRNRGHVAARRFHPGVVSRFKEFAVGHRREARRRRTRSSVMRFRARRGGWIEPGHAAGDSSCRIGRRPTRGGLPATSPERGFTVIADAAAVDHRRTAVTRRRSGLVRVRGTPGSRSGTRCHARPRRRTTTARRGARRIRRGSSGGGAQPVPSASALPISPTSSRPCSPATTAQTPEAALVRLGRRHGVAQKPPRSAELLLLGAARATAPWLGAAARYRAWMRSRRRPVQARGGDDRETATWSACGPPVVAW